MQKKLDAMINQKAQPKIEPGIIDLNDSNFDKTISSDNPTLVDFWAEWCGPCKQIAPALEELDNEMGDQITVAKINIDDNPMTPSKYGVRGIPTLILFKGGEVAATKVGAIPASALKSWVSENI